MWLVTQAETGIKRTCLLTPVSYTHLDAAGEIVSGTHPQYYGYSFDSGKQMNYFKPMLKDKSLKMVQDIEPNTAEHKLMQYSAMWNSTGEFIVEAGIEPVNVSKVTEKNELPYIFSQLCVNPDTSYFAVNAETEKIVGCLLYTSRCV